MPSKLVMKTRWTSEIPWRNVPLSLSLSSLEPCFSASNQVNDDKRIGKMNWKQMIASDKMMLKMVWWLKDLGPNLLLLSNRKILTNTILDKSWAKKKTFWEL